MPVSLSFAGETFRPMPCGALSWPAQDALLVADLHFEKGSAFGKKGWMLPPYDSADTIAGLIDALEVTGARRVWCLGDSFHDRGGPARMPAGPRAALQALTTSLDWLWISGNHDIVAAHEAAALVGGRVVAEARVGDIVLRHEAETDDATPEISGHFHPKVAVHIRGRRIVRRCFAMAATKLIMPAYGAFTGGLDVTDAAIMRVMGGAVTAVVAEGPRLLRFPVG